MKGSTRGGMPMERALARLPRFVAALRARGGESSPAAGAFGPERGRQTPGTGLAACGFLLCGRASGRERGSVDHGLGTADAHHGGGDLFPGVAAADAVCGEAHAALVGAQGALVLAPNLPSRVLVL